MTDQLNLNELARIFARGYLRLLKQSAQIESETGSIALAGVQKTALSVTRPVNKDSYLGEQNEY